MSFDGVVAETARSRADLAIQAALETWPHLSTLLNNYGEDDESTSWLLNKMLALSHVTQSCSNDQLGCGSVLLARLIIEEQQLDQNRSVGKTGKYASRFHPSSTADNIEEPGRARESYKRASTSRPLTVGEISANWLDGALLSESLLIRYNIEGSSPIPVIKNNILKILQKKQRSLTPPPSNPVIAEALSVSKRKIFITLCHHSQIPIASAALSDLCVSVDVADDASEAIAFALSTEASNETHASTVILVPPKDENESQAGIVQRILSKADDDSTFFVVHSSLTTLNYLKRLFGDDSPFMVNGFGRCTSIDKRIKMSLLMPTWADNTDPQQHNNAEMDPWMNILCETDLSEILSAQFVTD